MGMHGRARRIQSASSQRRRRREWFALDRETHRCGRTVVVGLGDSRVGEGSPSLAVASLLRGLLEAQPVAGVEVRQTCQEGPALVDLLAGFERALVVQCVHADGVGPGQVLRLEAWPCGAALGVGSEVQAEELRQALELAAQSGIQVPQPVDIVAIPDGAGAPKGEPVAPKVAQAIHAWLCNPNDPLQVRGD